MSQPLLRLWISLLVISTTAAVSPLCAQILDSSQLPILIINTQDQPIRDEPKIVGTFKIIDNGAGKKNSPSDKPVFESKIGIEYRGSSSQALFPKKHYGFELRDASGEKGVSASLLGWPEEEDYVLNATYNDKTLLRETLVHHLYDQMTDRYATRFRYCELIVNGNYEGIYILMEKIKRDKNRVNIAKLEPKDDSGDALTGGYILKIDKTTGAPSDYWESTYLPQPLLKPNLRIPIQVEYPKKGELTSRQLSYIRNHVSEFEKALQADKAAYANYIDVASWVDYLIINEVSRNVDAYRLSTFFYKDRDSKGGKLVMGPIWDFNLAFGNADYCQGERFDGWSFDFNTTCANDHFQMPFWWKTLLSDQAFATLVKQRYNALRQNVLRTDALHRFIDSTALFIQDARIRNFQRWPVMGQRVWPNYFIGRSYEEEINYLKNWITNRLKWMDNSLKDVDLTITSTEPVPASYTFLHAYPVPAVDEVTVEVRLPNPGGAQLRLVDMWGRTLRDISLSPSVVHHTYTLNVRSLASQAQPIFLLLEQQGQRLSVQRLVLVP